MKMSVGEKLKYLRQNKRYTQEEVANYIGKTKSFVCMYEADKRSPGKGTLMKLSKLFDVSLDYLMGEEKQKTYYNYVREDTALDYKYYPIIPMYENLQKFEIDDICGYASPKNLLPDHEDDNEVFYIAVETEMGRGWALVTRNSENEDSGHYVVAKDGTISIISREERAVFRDCIVIGKVRSLTYLL